ncbi:hypothetical protein MBLNU459_g7813t1 [Dothideomycetes sp. NU459]
MEQGPAGSSGAQEAQDQQRLRTQILAANPTRLGKFSVKQTVSDTSEAAAALPLEDWEIALDTANYEDARNLTYAAEQLRHSDVPVAFPTETVYGLGADATRSAAVKGIYHAKQRPSDNPLIVHIASLAQLRRLLRPEGSHVDGGNEVNGTVAESQSNSGTEAPQAASDPIPEIYHTLIRRFWPGPLTIILENPRGSKLAHEVTAGLSTFGARMPRNLLALALIKLADVPVAAPSANASTKPSPTAAEHVMHDLNGRIELILDGGLCDVGVESTVVDGLSSPPSILRPGGIGLDQIRECPGWEETVIGYRDTSEKGMQPRAPGMKYRHYSPKAPVILLEAGAQVPDAVAMSRHLGKRRVVGVVRTKTWPRLGGGSTIGAPGAESAGGRAREIPAADKRAIASSQEPAPNGTSANPIEEMLFEHVTHDSIEPCKTTISSDDDKAGHEPFELWDLCLGPDTKSVARGLFSALRDLDQRDVDAIVVEGIDDNEGDIAAAVMNRLRKAAELKLDQL